MRRVCDVTSFRDKRRKGTSRLEEEFLSTVESARFRIKKNKKKEEEEKREEDSVEDATKLAV